MNSPYNQPYYVLKQLLKTTPSMAHKELPITTILTNKITISPTDQDTITMARAIMDTITNQDVMIASQP